MQQGFSFNLVYTKSKNNDIIVVVITVITVLLHSFFIVLLKFIQLCGYPATSV